MGRSSNGRIPPLHDGHEGSSPSRSTAYRAAQGGWDGHDDSRLVRAAHLMALDLLDRAADGGRETFHASDSMEGQGIVGTRGGAGVRESIQQHLAGPAGG